MRSVLTALCLFASTAYAVPAQFTHQGRLLDADGAPLEDETTITFRVTDSESGGAALWEDDITVLLTNGFYSAVLGASEDNPLDTDVLSQAPVWLELQLDGEGAMTPRSPINAVPYATMATVAEEVSGGPVDASQIAVDGTPVVNELGEWVGPAPTVNWTDIEGMPEDFADGIDDDTDTDTDSFAALGTSCLDGDIPIWDSVLVEWVCGLDAVLTADEVDAIVADNGYAMESEVFSSSFLDLTDVPDGLDDGDDNTQLSEDEVDAMVSDNGYAMAADVFGGSFSDLSDVPEGLSDGDTTLVESEVEGFITDEPIDLSSGSTVGDVAISTGEHTVDTTLLESDVEGYITDGPIDLAAGSTVGGDDFSIGVHTVDTILSESTVEEYITDEAIDLAEGSTIGGEEVSTGAHTTPGPIVAMTSLSSSAAPYIRSASFTTVETFTIEKFSSTSQLNFQVSVGESISSYTTSANTQVRLYNETTDTEVRRVQGLWLYGPWMSTSTRDEISATTSFNAQEHELEAGTYTYALQVSISTPADNGVSIHGLSFTMFEVET